jgi:hypothetical protein
LEKNLYSFLFNCFNIVISKISTASIGFRLQARFIIEIHIKEINILNMIQSFFGGIGTITINPNKRSARYSVVGINDINNFIITHFENYPLQSVKKIDFDL